jgi:hypothetical protein
MPFNWETIRQMTDSDYARFLHIVCDNGTLCERFDFSTAMIYIKCCYADLKEHQRRVRSFQYQFIWDKNMDYVQFQISENVLQIDLAPSTQMMEISIST